MVALGFQKTRGELEGAPSKRRLRPTPSQSMLDVIIDDGTVMPIYLPAVGEKPRCCLPLMHSMQIADTFFLY